MSVPRRWLALAVATAAYVLGLFHRAAPATIAQDLAREFSTGAATLGVLAATYYWTYTLMQIPAGVLADTYGPRRLLVGGGIVAAAGAAMFATAADFPIAVVARLLVGLGASVAFVATLKLIATGFEARRFATLTGALVLLGNLSSALAGAPLAWLLAYTHWRTVMLLLAAGSLAVAVASASLVAEAPSARGVGSAAVPWREGLRDVLRNRATWPCFFANVGMGGAFLAFATLWAVPYLMEVHGMARSTAASHASLLLVGFALGSLALGVLSDWMRRRKPVFIAGAALLVIAWLPLLAGMPVRGASGFALFIAMGVASAGFTMSWACAKEVNRPQFSGKATAVVNMGIFVGPAALQPLVGALLDFGAPQVPGMPHSAAQWRGGIAAMTGFALFGLLASCAVAETDARAPHAGRAR